MRKEGAGTIRGESGELSLPSNIAEMYRLPGHREIGGRDYERYSADGEKYNELIRDEAESIRRIGEIKLAPESERAGLIRAGLNHPNPRIQFMLK